jgi:beta-phosphoglucomutase
MSDDQLDPSIEAFIFDMDGVLTETSKQHFLAWRRLAQELGCDLPQFVMDEVRGISRLDSLNIVLETCGIASKFDEAQKIALANQKNAYYLESIDAFSEADLSDGALELLGELKRRGFLIGLASASKNAPQLLKAMGIEHFFDAVVDPKAINEGKPAPDIFIKAAELLNVKPEHCIGIEDAYAGIESIKAAGMIAYGIGSKEVLTNCDHVFHNLKDLNASLSTKSFQIKKTPT